MHIKTANVFPLDYLEPNSTPCWFINELAAEVDGHIKRGYHSVKVGFGTTRARILPTVMGNRQP
ncbi:MAG: hypothetical protein ACYDBJ_04910 [Aggregatilineales bacterium]